MKLKLIATKDETADVRSFIFEPEEPITWKPGQFLYYTLPHPNPDDRKEKRWFTNSAAPSEGHVMISTRLAGEKGSSFKRALVQLKIGDEIEAENPDGDFTVDDPTKNYIFVAGGIGITPYRSILTEADAKGQQLRVKLLYSNRSADNVPFRAELDALAAKNPNLVLEYIFAPEKIDKERLQKELAKNEDAVVFVSGPEPMVEALNDELLALGLSEERIKTDYFPGYPAE